MIDAVLFDIDDTLCEYRRPGREVLDAAFGRVGVESFFAVEDYYAIYDDYAEQSDGVRDNRERCFAALASEAGYGPETGRSVASAYAEERDHRDVRFRPGVRMALSRLASDHLLGVVTNGAPEMQAQKLDALGIAEHFEVVVHGGHDAPYKPSPEPFHHALEGLSIEPERAVHVGNSIDADVAGAHAAGLQSVWIPAGEGNDPGGHEPHYTVETCHGLHEPPWL